jgi:hypothetical protein
MLRWFATWYEFGDRSWAITGGVRCGFRLVNEGEDFDVEGMSPQRGEKLELSGSRVDVGSDDDNATPDSGSAIGHGNAT